MNVGRRALLLAIFALSSTVQAAPHVERWTTRRGMPVYFVAAPEIPMFTLRVVFAAGSARDGDDPGIAAITNDLLGEGTAEQTPDEFHAALEGTGARMSTGLTRDMAWISLRSLTTPSAMVPAVDLLRSALRGPRVAPDVFTRTQRQMLAGLDSEEESPAALGARAIFRAIYGSHPYAMPPGGTRAGVRALTPSAADGFYRRYYVVANATLALVGALTRAQAEALADDIAQDLPTGEPAPPLPVVAATAAAGEQRIDFDAEQSHIIFGQPGISRTDPDYFPLVVGNHVLGGNGPVSMLFEEIRERRGLSYSVSSYFEPMAQAGPFIASLQTDRAREAEARAILRAQLERFVRDGPPADALKAAKSNLIGGFPLRIDSNAKLLEYLTIIGFYRLPLDYLEAYPRAVAAVTVAQVKDAFARRISPEHMARITVGSAASAP
jgi:zinc protease